MRPLIDSPKNIMKFVNNHLSSLFTLQTIHQPKPTADCFHTFHWAYCQDQGMIAKKLRWMRKFKKKVFKIRLTMHALVFTTHDDRIHLIKEIRCV